MTEWFARPVLHVGDVAGSLAFYVNALGFHEAWRHEEQGTPIVAQVDREGCALILASTWPGKEGKGTIFISLDPQPWSKEAQAEALDALRVEFAAKGAEVRDSLWGYRVVVVADLDGNELLFNYTD